MIKYPESNSEAEVQSCLHSDLCLDGFEVRANVSCGRGMHKVIFDLVIFMGRLAVAIIEVKKGHMRWSSGQKESYELVAAGIPIFLFNELSDYRILVSDLDRIKCRAVPSLVRDPCLHCGDRYALLWMEAHRVLMSNRGRH
jgi:hypothetical protein